MPTCTARSPEACSPSSSFMAVQATGAMAIVVADVGIVHSAEDPGRMLFTLSIVTGIVMLLAGLFKLGSILRFVSNAVMVGFINAVGVNIILGQLDDFTGYESEGANRVVRAFDLLLNFGKVHWPTLAIGISTIVLIVLLEKTKLGPLGMVVAIVIGSAAVANPWLGHRNTQRHRGHPQPSAIPGVAAIWSDAKPCCPCTCARVHRSRTGSGNLSELPG